MLKHAFCLSWKTIKPFHGQPAEVSVNLKCNYSFGSVPSCGF